MKTSLPATYRKQHCFMSSAGAGTDELRPGVGDGNLLPRISIDPDPVPISETEALEGRNHRTSSVAGTVMRAPV